MPVSRALPGLPPALWWAMGAGLSFTVLNALARWLTLDVPVMQAQFLRYACALLVISPFVLRFGWQSFRPASFRGQWLRGALHTIGLVLWFMALPKIPLADTTAMGFTTPLFIMLGARLFLGEAMHWERWLATVVGFMGVLVVVGPRLSGEGGGWHLVMLASAPVFAASFLLTKAMTRSETIGTILLWQALTVTIFSLPMALPVWQPLSSGVWLGFLVCGILGTAAHYMLTRSFSLADISSTQSLKFLDLIWSAILGWVVFSDRPSSSTLIGGGLIVAATVWVTRRESQRA
jgi:drug/metabolite transporter (DMT)-like permease